MPSSLETYNLIVSGSKSLNTEISSLQPSAQIIFYEIDLSNVSSNSASKYNYSQGNPINNGILRVYNDFNLYNLSIYPNGKIIWKNNFYYPLPIQAEGFEYNTNGTLPTPKFSISSLSPDNSLNSFYKYLRMSIESLGDILGAKFTRIKTFLKYLHGSNFTAGVNPYNSEQALYELELPKDIFYIDRKSYEDKNVIQYQLNSVLDLENLYLPGRTILAKKCTFQYRGEGCCYEYDSRLNSLHSGIYANTLNPGVSIRGLQTAPPVTTENEQLFIGQSGQAVFHTGDNANRNAIFRLTGQLGNSGTWVENANYQSGDFVFIERDSLKYYYVCINNNTSTIFNAPPNKIFWLNDACSKSIESCRYRWLKNPAFRPVLWPVNRGGETHKQTYDKLFAQALTNILIANPGITADATPFSDEKLGPLPHQNLEINRDWKTGVYNPTTLRNDPFCYPRRPGVEDPSAEYAHGIPKDANGNYLNGFLPFGGFPGVSKPEV